MMITGQGNGQGGREVGQKASQLPGYRHIDVLEERQEVAEVWGIPESEIPGEGAAATEMVKLMSTGEIKSCLVICSNLMVSLPDNAMVARALDNLDPLIVIDFFLSETAERADVVLPGAVWCEDEGTTTNLEGRMIKINQAVDPPGEARRDWEIVNELARRMGRGQYFDFHSSRDIFDEICRASKGGVADYAGISGKRSTSRAASSGRAKQKTIRELRACSPNASAIRMGAPAFIPSSTRQRPRNPTKTFHCASRRAAWCINTSAETRHAGSAFSTARRPSPG